MNRSASVFKHAATSAAVAPIALWVSDSPPGQSVLDAIGERLRLRPVATNDSIGRHADGAVAALIDATVDGPSMPRLSALLDQLERTGLVGLLLLDDPDGPAGRLANRRGQFAVASADAAPEVIAAHIDTLVRLQPAMANLHEELTRIRSFGSGATAGQIDEEMRMAARLQRDFMPHMLPEAPPVKFGILFRPAGWVSGDIYDVSRIDERNIGFYVVDAVGHGMPAALLTMFIKQALPTKRINGHEYEIIQPATAMAELNEAICAQELSNCQFCSAVYGVVNSETLELTYARGGHPEPLVLHADGTVSELDAVGGLLGIFPGESFDSGHAQLAPGDRVVLYSDGAEDIFRTPDAAGAKAFRAQIEKCRHLPPELMALQMAGVIDNIQGNDPPEDDITILILDVDADA